MTEDRPDPAALSAVLRDLRRVMDEGDAASPHAVLVTDPQTGARHFVGPYPSRLTARVGAMLTQARNVQDDPELADLTYEVVLAFAPGGDPAEVRP